MKKIRRGKYQYSGFEITNHGYYAPDKCIWWEAVDLKTGCGDFHGHTLNEVKRLIDECISEEQKNIA
jgi:hypothetical protein